MHRIKDKKLWFAVHFGRGHTPAPTTPLDIMGIGMVGAFFAMFALMLMLSIEAHAGASIAIVVAGSYSETLEAKRTEVFDKAQAILDKAKNENRPLTEQERADVKTAEAEMATLDEDIKTVVKQEARASVRETRRVEVGTTDNNTGAGPTSSRVTVGDPKPFRNIGENLVAIVNWADPKTREVHPRQKYIHEVHSAATGAGTQVPSDGGYLLEPTFAERLMSKIFGAGNILPNIDKIPLGPNSDSLKLRLVKETSRVTGSRWGGIRMYWVGESEAPTATKPEYRTAELELRELAGAHYATNNLMKDATAHGAVVEKAFEEESQFMLESGVFRGTDGAQPLGFLSAPGTVSVAKETGQAAATIVMKNLSKMWARMWARSRANAIWLYNQDCEPQLFELAIPVGTAALEPRFVTFAPDGSLRIFGRPAFPSEHCSSVGTVGDIIVADFSQYIAIQKENMQSSVSVHVKFLEREVTFLFVVRFDGQPVWESPLTPANGTSTLSPFVTLATRA